MPNSEIQISYQRGLVLVQFLVPFPLQFPAVAEPKQGSTEGQAAIQTEGLTKSLTEDQFLKENPFLKYDPRQGLYVTHAIFYREIIRYLFQRSIGYTDSTPKYEKIAIKLQTTLTARPFQLEALEAWKRAKRGVAVLPTGSGKSFLAALAIAEIQRSTLILAPTIDLIQQWQNNLAELFGMKIGLIGGGSFEVEEITVSTYDSARIHAERLGNRFGFLIFDECHHLPSPGYSEMARSFIAPYRLGLTATPNEEEDRLAIMHEITGPIIYQQQIQELSGEYLAPYNVEAIPIELTEEEKEEYDWHRELYMAFRDTVPQGFGPKNSWQRFVVYASQSEEGRLALSSFRRQKEIANSAWGKFEAVANILQEHNQERILIFTHDNKTAYRIASLFLLPLITHETKAKERKEVLTNFKSGRWPVLVNSRVLNEGVDVPEAGIAIVVSGTGTVREHVQRLGRILRNKEGKKAVLYELVTQNTTEIFTSKKRREHGAYRGF